MKTSLNEIKQTELYLSSSLSKEDSLLYETMMLINPVLKLNTQLQKRIYSIVKAYGRKQTKAEIESIHQKIFRDPANRNFQQNIQQLFINDNI